MVNLKLISKTSGEQSLGNRYYQHDGLSATAYLGQGPSHQSNPTTHNASLNTSSN